MKQLISTIQFPLAGFCKIWTGGACPKARGQMTDDRGQKKESSVGAAFQPRLGCRYPSQLIAGSWQLTVGSQKNSYNKCFVSSTLCSMRFPHMKLLPKLLFVICMLVISCSSQAENDFEKVISRIDKYFSEKPIFLTSVKTTADNEVMYAYYSIRVEEYNLTSDVRETAGQTARYQAFLTISCKVSDNAGSGDSGSKSSAFDLSEEIMPTKAIGFSTASLAYANQNFSSNSQPMTVIIRYSYQDANWSYDDISISGLGSTKSMINDLTDFPQNKAFREAIGMNN